MSTQTESVTTPPMQSPRGKPLAAVLLFVLSVLILFFASLQYYLPGKWWSSVEVLGWKGEAFTLVKGQGYGAQGKLTIDSLAELGVAVASLSPPVFRAEDYPVVQWSISSLNAKPETKVEFLWRTAENPSRVFAVPLEWAGNAVVPLHMEGDPNWRGQVMGLALMVHAPMDAPLTVEMVKFVPLASLGIVGREWFGTEPWLGTSINFMGGNETRQWLAPLPFVAAALGLAMIGFGLLVWRKTLVPDIKVLWALVFLAWFALDMRWQLDLWHKLGLTQQRYAGKSWEEKHLAAEDGRLFDFMRQVRTKLPSTHSRIYLFANEEYLRGRGSYHLYPFNVLNGPDLLPAEQYKSGDFIIILGKDEVGFDPSLNLLTWEPQQQLKADLLMHVDNNVLLRVR